MRDVVTIDKRRDFSRDFSPSVRLSLSETSSSPPGALAPEELHERLAFLTRRPRGGFHLGHRSIGDGSRDVLHERAASVPRKSPSPFAKPPPPTGWPSRTPTAPVEATAPPTGRRTCEGAFRADAPAPTPTREDPTMRTLRVTRERCSSPPRPTFATRNRRGEVTRANQTPLIRRRVPSPESPEP